MGEVIHAEHKFLASREAHIQAMEQESRLRDLAAEAAKCYYAGAVHKSNQIILDIPTEEKKQFRMYLQEYLKWYEHE